MKPTLSVSHGAADVSPLPLPPRKDSAGSHRRVRLQGALRRFRRRACLLSVAALLLCASASAALYTYTFTGGLANGGAVPDGDLTGWQDTRSVSDLPSGLSITDVNVTLNLSGGCNGDLYAYLVHGSGFAILLNRVGRTAGNPLGYDDPGFGPTAGGEAFRLDDQADHDVHGYQQFSYALNASGQLTSAWQPDGRNLHPLSAGVDFDMATRDAQLDRFNGLDPNGTWTLFFADVTSGGGQSTVQSWGLEVSVIPEAPPLGAAALLVLYAFAYFVRLRRGDQAH